MPKVTEAHLEARKQQIVDAAFLCFARKGFHPTTMQDICAQSQMSAGAVYRYFRSKEEIIQSACDASQAAIDAELLERALDEPDTRRMLEDLARAFFSRLEGPEAEVMNRALLQLWAETAVNDRVRDSYGERYEETRHGLLEVVREARRRGDFSEALSPQAIVEAMFALYDGFRLQKAIDPALNTEDYVRVVAALLTGAFWTGTMPSREAMA